MKDNDKILQLISSYVDNELSSEEMLRVEGMISKSLEYQKILEDYKKLKSLTASVKRLDPSPYFETKLMAEIESSGSRSKRIFKYYPVAALLVVTFGIMTLLKFNPDFMSNLWEQQKSSIAGFYKENLQPLFYASDITNEDIFNFAFNQELPLDKTKNQYLLLGYDNTGNEIVQIKILDNYKSADNYDQFIKALELNSSQKMQVDSIIRSYAKAIEPQILVNEKNTVAINPAVWSYRNALVADLLVLAKDLKKDKALNLIPSEMKRIEKIHLVDVVNKLKSSPENQFIFLTPDSVFSDNLEFNFAEQQKKLNAQKNELNGQKEILKKVAFNIQYDSTWKNLKKENYPDSKYKVKVGNNFCQVELTDLEIPELNIPELENINSLINEAADKVRFHTFHIPRVENVHKGVVVEYIDESDSLKTYRYNYHDIYLDSLMQLNKLMIDSVMRVERMKNPMFNDTVLSKWFYNSGDNFYQFNTEELRKQMEELQNEFRKFREEMNTWKNEVRREVNVKEK